MNSETSKLRDAAKLAQAREDRSGAFKPSREYIAEQAAKIRAEKRGTGK